MRFELRQGTGVHNHCDLRNTISCSSTPASFQRSQGRLAIHHLVNSTNDGNINLNPKNPTWCLRVTLVHDAPATMPLTRATDPRSTVYFEEDQQKDASEIPGVMACR